MADTTFTNGVTLSDAGWFNDANTVVYKGGADKILTGGGVGSVAVWAAAASFMPIGGVIPFAGTSAPTGWLLCDGSEVSRSTYANLFAVVSTVYGVGNGTTTFNTPDLRGRAIFGKDNMGGSTASRVTATSGVTGTTLGAVGGDERQQGHTHTGPSHTHTATTGTESADHVHSGPSHTHSGTTDNGGVDHTHTENANTAASPAFDTFVQATTTATAADNVSTGSITGGASAYLHAHTFTTAAAGTGNTGTVSANHTHNLTTAADGTGATGSTGAGSSQNLPPAIILNYIIKV